MVYLHNVNIVFIILSAEGGPDPWVRPCAASGEDICLPGGKDYFRFCS